MNYAEPPTEPDYVSTASDREQERATKERLQAAVTEACTWFSGDHIERIVAEQLEREEQTADEGGHS
jgi:hypothetical protein